MKHKVCKKCKQSKPVEPHFVGWRGKETKICSVCRAKHRANSESYEPQGRKIPFNLERCPFAAGQVQQIPFGGMM